LLFYGEARFRRDLTQRNLGALRREGFQPARRHPSASRHRYPSRALTDDELEELYEQNPGHVNNGNGYHSDGHALGGKPLRSRVRREASSEHEDHAPGGRRGVRREYSNEKHAHREHTTTQRSLSAPPVRIGALVPQGRADQVCVVLRAFRACKLPVVSCILTLVLTRHAAGCKSEL